MAVLRGWLEDELAGEIADGSVAVRGWVDHDEVPAELNRLRLLVMSSEPTEGLPTMILEALSRGTPVYATPVSGVVDVVREGETGWLMRSREPDAMVEGILDGLDAPVVSRTGRESIEAEYAFERAVERYDRILSAISLRTG